MVLKKKTPSTFHWCFTLDWWFCTHTEKIDRATMSTLAFWSRDCPSFMRVEVTLERLQSLVVDTICDYESRLFFTIAWRGPPGLLGEDAICLLIQPWIKLSVSYGLPMAPLPLSYHGPYSLIETIGLLLVLQTMGFANLVGWRWIWPTH
jgi:hypothetical protein